MDLRAPFNMIPNPQIFRFKCHELSTKKNITSLTFIPANVFRETLKLSSFYAGVNGSNVSNGSDVVIRRGAAISPLYVRQRKPILFSGFGMMEQFED